MKITLVSPPPPPKEIKMEFPVDEGWAIVAALHDYVHAHPNAAEVNRWREWFVALDAELRR